MYEFFMDIGIFNGCSLSKGCHSERSEESPHAICAIQLN